MRCRAHRQLGEVVDDALVAERLAAPGAGEQVEDLLHRPSPQPLLYAEGGELDRAPAEPEPEHQPAPAEELDGGGVLGQP